MQSWLRSIRFFSHRFADLWLQSTCPLCQRSASQPLCPACERQLHQLQIPSDQQSWQPPIPVFAWGYYGGSLKRAIAALKYDAQPQLARPLGDWLGQSWLSYHCFNQRSQESQQLNQRSPRSLIVVPIPLHPQKQQQRGFNQAELLAQSFCQRTGLPLFAAGLHRDRETVAQFGLSASDRKTNLAGAFSVNPDLRRRFPQAAVLLLDDIYTTGATANQATAILRRHQISVCGIVALAKATAHPAASP
ncbi:MAG: ComF family protein [Elainella sp. Prado103]|jgi:ComF family protein|nr:ComF family protein [Elainella sp. Prado103]